MSEKKTEKIGGSRTVPLLLTIVLGLTALIPAACATTTPTAAPISTVTSGPTTTAPMIEPITTVIPDTGTATSPSPSIAVNACAFPAREQAPAPRQRQPRSAPFSNATPVSSAPERPTAKVVAYPDLPPPALQTGTPIYATEELLEQAGVNIPGNVKDVTARTNGVRSILEHFRQATAYLQPKETEVEEHQHREARRETMRKSHDELIAALFGE